MKLKERKIRLFGRKLTLTILTSIKPKTLSVKHLIVWKPKQSELMTGSASSDNLRSE